MSDSTEIVQAEVVTDVERVGVGKVAELVEQAIATGMDPDGLDRLFGLMERMADRDARSAFFDALHAFQEECPEIAKSETAKIATRSGSGYSYTFAPLEGITRTIRPILHKHGLSYSWTTEPSELRAEFLNVVCVLRHIDGHEERAIFPVPTQTEAAMSGAQKQGAALTYGKRQSLTSVLGLTTSDDTDGAPRAQPIDGDQIEELNKLITEADADFRPFLDWMGVKALDEITVDQFPRAVMALNKKIRKRAES